MLLVSGRVVYYGEAAAALRYFEALGARRFFRFTFNSPCALRWWELHTCVIRFFLY